MQYWNVIGAAVIVYAALIGFLYFGQTSIIFPGGGPALPDAAMPPETENLTLETEDGISLKGIRIRGEGSDRPLPLILGFGGNAQNAGQAGLFLRSVFPEHDIVIFYYRGYGPSTGQTTAAALLSDAVSIHDYVSEQFAPEGIVTLGISVGSGPAARVAKDRAIVGVLLITPFDSLRAVARDQLFWAPVWLLFRHEMAPATDLLNTLLPVAIIGAGQDQIIPPRRTDALKAVVPNLVFETTIADTGHNDLYNRGTLREAMIAAMAAILEGGE